MVRNLLSNKGKEDTDMEKKQYIRPVVELIHHDYLCTPDLDAGVSAAEYWDARETDFMAWKTRARTTPWAIAVTTSGTENSRCMGSAPPCGFPTP